MRHWHFVRQWPSVSFAFGVIGTSCVIDTSCVIGTSCVIDLQCHWHFVRHWSSALFIVFWVIWFFADWIEVLLVKMVVNVFISEWNPESEIFPAYTYQPLRGPIFVDENSNQWSPSRVAVKSLHDLSYHSNKVLSSYFYLIFPKAIRIPFPETSFSMMNRLIKNIFQKNTFPTRCGEFRILHLLFPRLQIQSGRTFG